MTIIHVQFSDASESAVVSVFGCAQDSDAYPNQGQVEDSDPRYLSFINPPPQVPYSVSRRQGRLALLEVGKLDDAEAAIDAIADPVERRAAQIEYEADTWERGNAFLQSMWGQLGGTEAELNDLFILAKTK